MPILQVHFVQTFRLKTLPSHQQGYVPDAWNFLFPLNTLCTVNSFGMQLAQALMPTSLHMHVPMSEHECSYLTAKALFLNIIF